MGRKGFSGTTLIMVAVLVFALFMVGKMVNPPPPGPPEQPKNTAAPAGKPVAPGAPPMSQKEKDAQIKAQVAMMKSRMSEEMKLHQKGGKMAHTNSMQKKFDPNTIEVTPSYFDQNDDGKKGEEQMQEKVAKAKAEQAIENANRKLGMPVSSAPPPTGSMPASAH